MRSSPQVGFATAAILRINCRRSLGRGGRPVGFDFQRQKSQESLPVPADEGVGLDDHQRHPPIEQPSHGGHQPPGSIVGPVRLDLPLLEERQLLSQKQVFRRQRCAGTYHQDKQPTQVEEGDACS